MNNHPVDYSSSAIKIHNGGKISLNDGNTTFIRTNAAGDEIDFYINGTIRFKIDSTGGTSFP